MQDFTAQGACIIKVFLHTDGGLLNVTGHSKPYVVWGFTITHPNGTTTLHEASSVVEREGSNNEAEYLGVINGLRSCLELGAREVLLHVDSQMVAYQLTGTYAVKAEHLRSYFKTARALVREFDHCTVLWVPREKNTRADMLCHRAMHLWRHQNGHKCKDKQPQKNNNHGRRKRRKR